MTSIREICKKLGHDWVIIKTPVGNKWKTCSNCLITSFDI